LTDPNGGEIRVGTVTITWSASDPDAGETELLDVDLEFSDDAGTGWSPIDSNQVNDGVFLWDVSSLSVGDEYLIRITVTDTKGLSASDTSDGLFSVAREIFITDQTGKRWEITHAVHVYNMQPENFRYGLGPYAITPINDPEMISPGEPGYPDDTSSIQVIGTNVNGDARAYSTSVLSSHEVVNDIVGGEPVSVIY
jgi:hypothetical protein